jgi:hypothetical protein
MTRLFVSLVFVGLALDSTYDTAVRGAWPLAVMFAAMTLFIGIPAWRDLRRLTRLEADLRDAQALTSFVTDLGVARTSEAAVMLNALLVIRDLTNIGQFESVTEAVHDALAEWHDAEFAKKCIHEWLDALEAGRELQHVATPKEAAS